MLTQLELEQRLASGRPLSARMKQVVMIQCVGSRGADLAYCSRVCCGQALKNALRLKAMNPDLTIFIYYRDMRAYGFMEDDYRQARELGVIFIRYARAIRPQSWQGRSKSSPLKVVGYDPLLGEEVELDADLLVLSVGIVPEDPSILSRMLKVPVTADKFYLEAHVKLRPVDMAVDGIFVCGLAHAPQIDGRDHCPGPGRSRSGLPALWPRARFPLSRSSPMSIRNCASAAAPARPFAPTRPSPLTRRSSPARPRPDRILQRLRGVRRPLSDHGHRYGAFHLLDGIIGPDQCLW